MNKPVIDRPDRGAISLEALRGSFAKRLGLKTAAKLDAAQNAFVAQVHQHCAADELSEMNAADLTALLERFWTFAERRKPDQVLLRLVTAQGEDGQALDRDVLEVVLTDSPFVVDTVMGELVQAGAVILAMFHPVVTTVRDKRGHRDAEGTPCRESMLHVLMEPVGAARGAQIVAEVQAALADLRLAVADFPDMLSLMSRTIAELAAAGLEADAVEEPLAFLRWLEADRFVFLGARVYDYPPEGSGLIHMPVESSLGVLRDHERVVLRDANDPALQASRGDDHTGAHGAEEPLVVAKSNTRSRVHRRVYMDYVGIKRYGPDLKPCGEVRFVGLFTSEAYDQRAVRVPFVRRKVEQVLQRAGYGAESHNGRRLRNILESYPRDELFQIGEDELLSIALKVMHLYDRPRLRLFVRNDPFDRFVSILLFLPRDRYNEAAADEAGRILAAAWGGRVSAAYPSFSDAPLARVHYIVGLEPGAHPVPDVTALEAQVLQATRTWNDGFEAALRTPEAEEIASLAERYRQAFPAGYRDQFPADEALADIPELEALSESAPVRVRMYRVAEDGPEGLRLKLYRRGEAAALSDVMPILERMGLRALVEHGFPVHPAGGDSQPALWVHEILLQAPGQADMDFEAVNDAFETAFVAIWSGQTENDGFNRLVLELGIGWREAALVRALARYRQQSGLDPSQAVQEAALSNHPGVARLILDMFRTKFDPALRASVPVRQEQAEAVYGEVVEALQQVSSLDDDRVLRRLALLVRAVKRTNYYQRDAAGEPKPYISFKVASQELDDLPAPKPYREIFVWSPQVEGVHLRFGPVARGGLRWSDRRDDFRTEVLSLAKAQQVKNAVIVPVGAKGGFYPKRLPKGGTPDEVRAEGVSAYRTYLHGLLDITDNLDPAGKVTPPQGVIRHEGDDPYLVVAADKGTATFSDIANGVSEDFGFWLGDAFASGGSAGYDHKAMGITARGAWEAVKRHFRELGKDIQTEPFTVIGVGDMSGDVFGNGMLLSEQTLLVAAFDHRHIFFDPAPDAAATFKERTRMFALPRSSWADFDAGLISPGGGIFPRTAKSIPLSAQMKALLEVDDDALAPTDLIRAILKAPAELLYLGGIGTYVKSPTESHAEVGDKANDPVRIDGGELRVKVVGEGANLGFTQAGRIAYAKFGAGGAGGRIDTDAIDNSAGVDTSDHEVNIKILTGGVERKGDLTRKARDKLLRSMTDEIAEHVLSHNYDQTLALSLQEATAAAELDSHAAFMAELVAQGRLDRRVEGLPGPVVLADLAKTGGALARPELAVLLAYGKLELSRDIVASDAPEDPFFAQTLKDYFPTGLGRFEAQMQSHPLRREIVATVLANEIVNLTGPTFPSRLTAAVPCDTRALVAAFEAARRIYRTDAVWAAIGAQDARIPAEAQTALYLEAAASLRRQVFWLARRAVSQKTSVGELIDAHRPAADALRKEGDGLFSDFERARIDQMVQAFVTAGAPPELAEAVAGLSRLMAVSDIADLAKASGWTTLPAGRLYHQVGAIFGFDRVRQAAADLTAGDAFERKALRRLIESLLIEQAGVAASVAAEAGKAPSSVEGAAKAVEAWAGRRAQVTEGVRRALAEIESAEGGWSFPKLTIAASALRELTGV